MTRSRRPSAQTTAVVLALPRSVVREPAAAAHLPPAAAAYLAVVLAGCVWFAIASRCGTNLAVAGAVAFATWFLLAFATDGGHPLLGVVLVVMPAAAFFVPAFVAGRRDRSFHSGVRAIVWTVIAAMPLAYALWLPEAQRRHAIDGRTLDGELIAPVGVNLADALTFRFGIFPVLGLTVGLVGAALGARLAIRPALIAG